MSKQFRLNPETGVPEVMVLEPGGPVLIGKEKRASQGRLINIHHFYDPGKHMMVFHLDGIRIDMLCYDEEFSNGQIYYTRDNRDEHECDPVTVDYDKPVLFIVSGDEARLTDLEGKCLSGSNVHDHGVLCLGNSFNPMSMEALEMLLYNEPNHDLGWFGSPIQINQNNIPMEDGELCSEITLWPAQTSYRIELSRKMSGVLAHLQP